MKSIRKKHENYSMKTPTKFQFDRSKGLKVTAISKIQDGRHLEFL
jgi:hypothetical protein